MNYFEKNLKVLEKYQPELAEMMREEIDTSHIEVFTSDAGIPTARVTTPKGEKVILHDEKDPVAKAKDHVKKLNLIGNNGSILLGFGLGYLALEIVKEPPLTQSQGLGDERQRGVVVTSLREQL